VPLVASWPAVAGPHNAAARHCGDIFGLPSQGVQRLLNAILAVSGNGAAFRGTVKHVVAAYMDKLVIWPASQWSYEPH
jgi:hypothetical protein